MDKFNTLLGMIGKNVSEEKVESFTNNIISDINKNFSDKDNKLIISHLNQLKLSQGYILRKHYCVEAYKEYNKLV